MVLKLEVLNSDALLNHFEVLGAAQFVPGTPQTIVMRIKQSERNLRYVPSAAATMSMVLTKSDNTTITVTPTFLDAGDRSLITLALTAGDTTDLISQNLVMTITDGALVCTAQFAKGLQSAALASSC